MEDPTLAEAEVIPQILNRNVFTSARGVTLFADRSQRRAPGFFVRL
jgi:hypothetical protein